MMMVVVVVMEDSNTTNEYQPKIMVFKGLLDLYCFTGT